MPLEPFLVGSGSVTLALGVFSQIEIEVTPEVAPIKPGTLLIAWGSGSAVTDDKGNTWTLPYNTSSQLWRVEVTAQLEAGDKIRCAVSGPGGAAIFPSGFNINRVSIKSFYVFGFRTKSVSTDFTRVNNPPPPTLPRYSTATANSSQINTPNQVEPIYDVDPDRLFAYIPKFIPHTAVQRPRIIITIFSRWWTHDTAWPEAQGRFVYFSHPPNGIGPFNNFFIDPIEWTAITTIQEQGIDTLTAIPPVPPFLPHPTRVVTDTFQHAIYYKIVPPGEIVPQGSYPYNPFNTFTVFDLDPQTDPAVSGNYYSARSTWNTFLVTYDEGVTRGVEMAQLHGNKFLLRAYQVAGLISLDRSLNAGKTWPIEEIDNIYEDASEEAIPSILITHHDRVMVWFHDSNDIGHCYLSFQRASPGTFQQYASHAGLVYPRAVWFKGKTFIFAHDGDETIKVYSSNNFGQSLNEVTNTIEGFARQLVQVKVDRFGFMHIFMTRDGSLMHSQSADGYIWSTPTAFNVGHAIVAPGLALGIQRGLTTFWQDEELSVVYTTPGFNEPDFDGTPPTTDFFPNQVLGLLRVDQYEYLSGWYPGAATRPRTEFSKDRGNTWELPN